MNFLKKGLAQVTAAVEKAREATAAATSSVDAGASLVRSTRPRRALHLHLPPRPARPRPRRHPRRARPLRAPRDSL